MLFEIRDNKEVGLESIHVQLHVFVISGETVSGTFSCNRHAKDVRGLKITVCIKGKKYDYTLD